MKIKLLITGGVINKVYDIKYKKLSFSSQSIFNILNQMNCTSDISIETLFLKEIQNINKKDMKLIAKSCELANEDKILINFNSLKNREQTLNLLDKLNYLKKKKTILIFDSTIPYQFEDSDALFNLGAVITVIPYLKNGIFIFKETKIIEQG